MAAALWEDDMHTVVKGATLWMRAFFTYALALPTNTASAAKAAIPVINDFVMIVPSSVVQGRMGGAPPWIRQVLPTVRPAASQLHGR